MRHDEGTEEERAKFMDEACDRAWAKRHAAYEIIKREMYGRQRAAGIAHRPWHVVSDTRSDYLEAVGIWIELDD